MAFTICYGVIVADNYFDEMVANYNSWLDGSDGEPADNMYDVVESLKKDFGDDGVYRLENTVDILGNTDAAKSSDEVFLFLPYVNGHLASSHNEALEFGKKHIGHLLPKGDYDISKNIIVFMN